MRELILSLLAGAFLLILLMIVLLLGACTDNEPSFACRANLTPTHHESVCDVILHIDYQCDETGEYWWQGGILAGEQTWVQNARYHCAGSPLGLEWTVPCQTGMVMVGGATMDDPVTGEDISCRTSIIVP